MCAPGASRRRAIVFVGVDMTRRCVSTRLYFHLFPLFLRPVFSIGLFLRYFNDLSCI
jgi:hypothetical protein